MQNDMHSCKKGWLPFSVALFFLVFFFKLLKPKHPGLSVYELLITTREKRLSFSKYHLLSHGRLKCLTLIPHLHSPSWKLMKTAEPPFNMQINLYVFKSREYVLVAGKLFILDLKFLTPPASDKLSPKLQTN